MCSIYFKTTLNRCIKMFHFFIFFINKAMIIIYLPTFCALKNIFTYYAASPKTKKIIKHIYIFQIQIRDYSQRWIRKEVDIMFCLTTTSFLTFNCLPQTTANLEHKSNEIHVQKIWIHTVYSHLQLQLTKTPYESHMIRALPWHSL